VYALIRGSKGKQPASTVKKPRHGWRTGFVSYIKHKVDERAAKKQQETPTDKAARITAKATAWMAGFTFILAATSAMTG
jgi:hypothetical protein